MEEVDPIELGQRIHAPLMSVIADQVKDRDTVLLIGRMIDTLTGSVALKVGRDALRAKFTFSDYTTWRCAIVKKLLQIPAELGGMKK